MHERQKFYFIVLNLKSQLLLSDITAIELTGSKQHELLKRFSRPNDNLHLLLRFDGGEIASTD